MITRMYRWINLYDNPHNIHTQTHIDKKAKIKPAVQALYLVCTAVTWVKITRCENQNRHTEWIR